MRSCSILVVCIIVLGALSIFRPASADSSNKRLRLSLIKHQPCTAKPTPSERIRFPNSVQAPLVDDPERGPGCYILKGPVRVSKAVYGTVQIALKSRINSRGDPEKCSGADVYGCGGIGSCVYCDICQTKRDLESKTSTTVHVLSNGKPIDCDRGIAAGNHSDISISFCMCTKEEFFKATDTNEELWNSKGTQGGGHLLFLQFYLFNQAVNKLSSSALNTIASDDSDQVIGCHKWVCKVYDAE